MLSFLSFRITGETYDSFDPPMIQTYSQLPSYTMDVHGYDHKNREEFSADSWIQAIASMVIIGLAASACVMLIPTLKSYKHYDRVNQFLMALAVGTLSGDALIHLFPHAINMELPPDSNPHVRHPLYGFTALIGITFFLILERFYNLCSVDECTYGHSLAQDLAKSKEYMDKEPVGTATTTVDTGNQNIDKRDGKKSEHSKHNSFTCAESPLDTQSCFDSCTLSLSSDANWNVDKANFGDGEPASVPEETNVSCIEKSIEKETLASTATVSLATSPVKNTGIGGRLSHTSNTPTSVRSKLATQNSKNLNMVLHEYFVGHHGHSHHGHSHIAGRKDTIRVMIFVGDVLHTFLDGLAIGAAFGTSITTGLATAFAVLCHELPHKVGDFALLFEMGMTQWQAVYMMARLWLFSFAGVITGVLLGSSKAYSPWLYSLTAGVFIYLALVDLLPELSVNHGDTFGLILLGLGMLSGASIMLLIAIYEHDFEGLIKGAF